MRVAIFQKSKRHSEVFGFIMEYCKRHDIDLDIYVTKYKFWYGPYFNKVLGTNCATFGTSKITPKTMRKYDYVFVTTGQDIKGLRGVLSHKLIYIHHIPNDYRRRSINIALTPLISKCTYLFPVYNAVTEIKQKENIFGIVGTLKARNLRDLGRTLNKFKNRNFKVYVFTVSHRDFKDKRMNLFRRVSTEKMTEKLKECKFLLSIPFPDSYYYKNRLTGELPLAYSHNVPICLPQRLNSIYGLKGAVTYKKSLTEVFGQLLDMKGERYTKLVRNLSEQRERIIRTNHKRLRKLMKIPNKPSQRV